MKPRKMGRSSTPRAPFYIWPLILLLASTIASAAELRGRIWDAATSEAPANGSLRLSCAAIPIHTPSWAAALTASATCQTEPVRLPSTQRTAVRRARSRSTNRWSNSAAKSAKPATRSSWCRADYPVSTPLRSRGLIHDEL